MQAVYQAEVAKEDVQTALNNISQSENFIAETMAFATILADKAWSDREQSDQIISDLAIDWEIDRIGKVDRSILRLAISEINGKETPISVVINEAVELAKKYSSAESSKFINGILGAFVRKSDAAA